jgi:acyl-CoA thioester hydrolase
MMERVFKNYASIPIQVCRNQDQEAGNSRSRKHSGRDNSLEEERDMEIKIYYEDTDCGNVVYYANYLKYFERARTEYMNKCGIDLKKYHDSGIFFVVASAKVDYRSPARYGETIIDETWVSEKSRASFTFKYKLMEKNSKRLLVEGETRIVTVDREMKPKRLAEELICNLT